MITEQEVAGVFKALSDENRLRILKLLHSGEKCACHMLEELDISQPTLSHHMKILCDARIVNSRKEGKWVHYSLNCEGTCWVRKLFMKLTLPENRPAHCTCRDSESHRD